MKAIVLEPLAEPAMRQSLLISNGSFAIFLERPISAAIMAIAIVMFALPLLKIARDRWNRRQADRPA